ncbi:ABC transporter ATP-binding protein [Deinococcus ruber]|uniref:ABC transporter ATP-binding protein n=1 Tax=Deinococcus ruber TaxID=1848197 RepID=A0A918CL57_9DEIO|nr:ATP-binding cassette domain-containing protein [Deinococcus ruber]GGR28812.1 ABC transporter ATP-binding protein [Deinococcus ruber]
MTAEAPVPLLRAEGLSRHVEGRPLWQRLRLELRESERLAVVGPSGSGKTLLLRALAGLDVLEHGVVYLDERPQTRWAMPDFRSRVMYLPQRPALGTGTVLDELRQPFSLKVHAGKQFNKARAAELLVALGRPASFLTLNLSTLSGGEQQTVALIRALLLDPAVLLLDEATASLDPEAARLAEAELLRWNEVPGRALIWVSHDPAQRERIATHHLDIQRVSVPAQATTERLPA